MSILTPALYNKIDVTGETFGQYTVLGKVRTHYYPSGRSHPIWRAICSCGSEVETQAQKIFNAKYGCKACNGKFISKTDSCHWRGGKYVSHYFLSKVIAGANRKSRKLEVSVTIEYLDKMWSAQDGKCAYTNLKLEIGGSGEETTASLDRIDSDKGYIEGNVHFVHKQINKMKWDLTDEEFRSFCRLVVENG